VESTQYEGLHYTLFPERVNYTEAAAACSYLPDGRLAQLDTQAALTVVSKALLPTLPMQVGRWAVARAAVTASLGVWHVLVITLINFSAAGRELD
jgi:hypothetical protein